MLRIYHFDSNIVTKIATYYSSILMWFHWVSKWTYSLMQKDLFTKRSWQHDCRKLSQGSSINMHSHSLISCSSRFPLAVWYSVFMWVHVWVYVGWFQTFQLYMQYIIQWLHSQGMCYIPWNYVSIGCTLITKAKVERLMAILPLEYSKSTIGP